MNQMKNVRLVICFLTVLTLLNMEVTGQTENSGETIIDPVEIMASFPGGSDSLKRFIEKNLIQPTKNKKNGTVYVAFIVNKDGTTSDFEIERGLTKECNERALDVLRKMPVWTPGTQGGVVIRQRFIMPVKFE